jgi:quercetin dioxygenase-like cupin family protein
MRSSLASKSLLTVLATAVLLLGQARNEKKPANAKPEIVPITEEQHHHLVLENEYVRVFHVEVAPHSETKFHQHDMDYVFVTLGDSVVENDRIGEKPAKLELKDGQTVFVKGGFAHKAVNLSDKPFVNVTVELKKKFFDSTDISCGEGALNLCVGAEAGNAASPSSETYVLRSKNLDIERRIVPENSSFNFCGSAGTLVVFFCGGGLSN